MAQRTAAELLAETRVALRRYEGLGLEDLERLANSGDPVAMIARGDAVRRLKGGVRLPDYKVEVARAEPWYRMAYDASHSILSIHRLATALVMRGYTRQAIELLKEGAASDDCVCLHSLARIYRLDRLADDSEILALLRKAAALGHLRARVELGKMLVKAKGAIWEIPLGLALYLSGILEMAWVGFHDIDDPRLW